MKFKAEIDIMPLDALLDPQGKAVTSSLKNIGLEAVSNVRIGRHIRMFIESDSKEEASKIVDEACDKLLVNKIMESYTFSIEEV